MNVKKLNNVTMTIKYVNEDDNERYTIGYERAGSIATALVLNPNVVSILIEPLYE